MKKFLLVLLSVVFIVGCGDDESPKEIEVKSDTIYKTLPSNQMTRVFDNVPRKAKALTLSGNRVVMGNYVENFNLKDGNGKKPKQTPCIKRPKKKTEPPKPKKKSLLPHGRGYIKLY